MPVNAPAEYYAAEKKFNSSKNRSEKIAALEEMIRMLPKHHGSEQMHAQLKGKLAKMKKEGVSKKSGRKVGVEKEGDAQVCILGFTNSGKSTLLRNLTNARPKISSYKFTTKKPEVGMIDYDGVKIQLVELPSTFEPEFMGIARTANLLVLLAGSKEEESRLKSLLRNNFIRVRNITVIDPQKAKKMIWDTLGLILVYTKKTNTPMALQKGSTVKDFASKIHKDFLKNFRFARVFRKGRMIQAGLNYHLQDMDIVEIYLK
jgi:ribosome-interacting GTPase 1